MTTPERKKSPQPLLLFDILVLVAKLPGNALKALDGFLEQQIKLAVIEGQVRRNENAEKSSQRRKTRNTDEE